MLEGILPQRKKILCHRWAVFKEFKDTVDFSETLNKLFFHHGVFRNLQDISREF